MIVYVYCSYDGSPVGFQLGKITYDASRTENYALEELENPSLITKVFFSGNISRAWGWNKGNESYFALYKNIDGSGWYMNFAFEFSDFAEFKKFKGNMDGLGSEKLVEVCLPLVLKSNDEYGVQVDAKALRFFVEGLEEKEADVKEGRTYFESPKQVDVSQRISETVGFQVAKKGDVYVSKSQSPHESAATCKKKKGINAVAVGLCLSLLANGVLAVKGHNLKKKIDALNVDTIRGSVDDIKKSVEDIRKKLDSIESRLHDIDDRLDGIESREEE